MIAQLPLRERDSWGEGYFGASRGKRKHHGIDYACWPGSEVLAPVSGIVTKIGYPYADDLRFRYVQITADKLHYRIFYVEPAIGIMNQQMDKDETVIGYSQDLHHRYPSITQHIHVEVKDGKKYLNPEDYL